MNESYDCIVIGGGPAGSTVATLTADAGNSTLLVEREQHPRFHVGESLMPETYWIFERLGILPQMRESDFVRKVSVQFVNGSGKESQPFFFDKHDDRECSTTWQVERAKFDKLLFDNAAAKGADCIDQTRVLDVLFDGDRASGVRLQTADGQQHEVQSKVVIDATGQRSMLAEKLGLKRVNPDLKKAAIWTYYDNAYREEGPNGGATLILSTRDKMSWFWYIPLSDGITSVGLVADNDHILKRGKAPEQVFEEHLANCPALEKRLKSATRTDEHHVIKEFSYLTEQPAGEGWVLVGDAWGFIDPIYSSGVYFAMKSGEMAADAINQALEKGDTSGQQLGKWASEFSAATIWVRKLVHAFYTPEFSFGKFMQANPGDVGRLTDLLIGRIFHDGAGEIFDRMEPMLAQAREMNEPAQSRDVPLST